MIQATTQRLYPATSLKTFSSPYIPPSTQDFNHQIEELFRYKKHEKAWQMFNQMREPNMATYQLLFKNIRLPSEGYEDLDRAVHLFFQLNASQSREPLQQIDLSVINSQDNCAISFSQSMLVTLSGDKETELTMANQSFKDSNESSTMDRENQSSSMAVGFMYQRQVQSSKIATEGKELLLNILLNSCINCKQVGKAI